MEILPNFTFSILAHSLLPHHQTQLGQTWFWAQSPKIGLKKERKNLVSKCLCGLCYFHQVEAHLGDQLHLNY